PPCRRRRRGRGGRGGSPSPARSGRGRAAPRASARGGRGLRGRRRGRAPSRSGGCASWPRPSRPWRSRGRGAAPRGRRRGPRRTRRGGGAGGRGGTAPGPLGRRSSGNRFPRGSGPGAEPRGRRAGGGIAWLAAEGENKVGTQHAASLPSSKGLRIWWSRSGRRRGGAAGTVAGGRLIGARLVRRAVAGELLDVVLLHRVPRAGRVGRGLVDVVVRVRERLDPAEGGDGGALHGGVAVALEAAEVLLDLLVGHVHEVEAGGLVALPLRARGAARHEAVELREHARPGEEQRGVVGQPGLHGLPPDDGLLEPLRGQLERARVALDVARQPLA